MNTEQRHKPLWFIGVMIMIGAVVVSGISMYDGIRFWTIRFQGQEVEAVVADLQVVTSSDYVTIDGRRRPGGSENRVSIVIPSKGQVSDSDTYETGDGMDAFFANLNKTISEMDQVPAGQVLERRRVPDRVLDGLYPGLRVRAMVSEGVDDMFLLGYELTRTPLAYVLEGSGIVALGLLVVGALFMALGWKRRGR